MLLNDFIEQLDIRKTEFARRTGTYKQLIDQRIRYSWACEFKDAETVIMRSPSGATYEYEYRGEYEQDC